MILVSYKVMKENEFLKLQKEGKVEEIKQEEMEKLELSKKLIPTLKLQITPRDETYLPMLELLKVVKKHGTVIPTYKPTSFIEQLYFYESGTARRLYVYLNNTWQFIGIGDSYLGSIVKLTEFSTISLTYVDVTDLIITATTGGGRVLLLFSASVQHTTATGIIRVTFDVDGSIVADPLHLARPTSSLINFPISMSFITPVLTAASHTFKVKMYVNEGTGYLLAPTIIFNAIQL